MGPLFRSKPEHCFTALFVNTYNRPIAITSSTRQSHKLVLSVTCPPFIANIHLLRDTTLDATSLGDNNIRLDLREGIASARPVTTTTTPQHNERTPRFLAHSFKKTPSRHHDSQTFNSTTSRSSERHHYRHHHDVHLLHHHPPKLRLHRRPSLRALRHRHLNRHLRSPDRGNSHRRRRLRLRL